MIKKTLVTLNILMLLTSLAVFNPKIAAAKSFNINNFDGTSGLKDTGELTGHTNVINNDLEVMIPHIINIALSLVGIFFLILMLYSGFLWMTARTDSKAIEKAKENIKNALIGLIIVLGAYAITKLILGLLEIAAEK